MSTRDEPQLDRAEFARRGGYEGPGTVTRLLLRARTRREELIAAGRHEEAASPALFPEPDGTIGRTPWWYESTVERFLEYRHPLGSGGKLPGPGSADQERADSGPGNCPICQEPYQSVLAHRRRKASCSYDPGIRARAADEAVAASR